MYRIEYRRPARKALMRMPHGLAARFLDAFELVAIDPNRNDLDIKRLSGRDGCRLRIGGWRALFRIEGGQLVVPVLDIGARRDVYK
jgi:mRNA interferase RelE/StbE